MPIVLRHATSSESDILTIDRTDDATSAASMPGLARFRWVAGAHVAALLALAAGASASTLSWRAVAWLTGCSLVGHLVLFGWIRSGVENLPARRDSGNRIAFVHTLLSFGVLAVACTLHPPVCTVAPQLMFVIIAFDIHRLSRRQVLCVGAAGFATAALSLLMGSAHIGLVNVVTVGGSLAALIVVGQRMRSIQAHQQEQKAALAATLTQWQALSRHDALTAALSRRYGTELLELEMARQRRDRQPLSLALLDVDHFKRINDTHGHALGDEVLIDLVRLADESMGEPKKVVRWGGEEFLLLLPATSEVEAARLSCRMRERIVAHDWSGRAPGLAVDVSIGVTEHRPSDTMEASVARADAALYVAKAEGRGRVVRSRR